MITVLVTGSGSGGSRNLINSLRKSSINIRVIGTDKNALLLQRSIADKNYLIPSAMDKLYIEALNKIIRAESVDLIIPNNDEEIGVISLHRNHLQCKYFLPDEEVIYICQEKHKLYKKLITNNIPMAKSFSIESYSDLNKFMTKLKYLGHNKFWIRPKVGSASKGATWVETFDQAKAWISLWVELQGYSLSDFTVSEFLPGRDYACQSIWNNGQLIAMKLCQRLSYFYGVHTLSGMSSTPEIAKTIIDNDAIDIVQLAIKSLSEKPHGVYCVDLKGDNDGVMNITEINIGRFFMITPIFDLTGKINTAEAYVKCALEGSINSDIDPFDFDPDQYLLRGLDFEPIIKKIDQLDLNQGSCSSPSSHVELTN